MNEARPAGAADRPAGREGDAPGAPAGRPAPRDRRRRSVGAALGIAAGAALVAIAALTGLRDRGEPSRCADGMIALGARCCGDGQRLEQGHRCAGTPSRCGPLHAVTADGCVPAEPAARRALGGHPLRIGPGDWEAQGVVTPREADVPPFEIDVFEVTEARWTDCARAGGCAPRPAGEPGVPVTGVTFDEASAFCAWAGGRLPARDELAAAIARDGGRRYPWGDTGAVCRRGAWGLAAGPCATGGAGPDVAGSHPDGASREGVHDLAGNVAEWAASPGAAGDLADVLGGSWQDAEAAALRGWSHRSLPRATRSPAVGFRCVYTSP